MKYRVFLTFSNGQRDRIDVDADSREHALLQSKTSLTVKKLEEKYASKVKTHNPVSIENRFLCIKKERKSGNLIRIEDTHHLTAIEFVQGQYSKTKRIVSEPHITDPDMRRKALLELVSHIDEQYHAEAYAEADDEQALT